MDLPVLPLLLCIDDQLKTIKEQQMIDGLIRFYVVRGEWLVCVRSLWSVVNQRLYIFINNQCESVQIYIMKWALDKIVETLENEIGTTKCGFETDNERDTESVRKRESEMGKSEKQNKG